MKSNILKYNQIHGPNAFLDLLLKNQGISHIEFRILIYMVNQDDSFNPSLSTIASNTGLKKPNVARCLNALVNKNVLTKTGRDRKCRTIHVVNMPYVWQCDRDSVSPQGVSPQSPQVKSGGITVRPQGVSPRYRQGVSQRYTEPNKGTLKEPTNAKTPPLQPQGHTKEKGKIMAEQKKKAELTPMELLAIYQENRGDLTGFYKPTKKRLTAAKQRIKEEPTKEYWISTVKRLAESAFATGENDRGWTADIDFFLRPDVHVRINEGKYDNKDAKTKKQVKPAWKREVEANERRMAEDLADLIQRRKLNGIEDEQ